MYDATYKVVLFGDPNTGKACLIEMFLTNLFNSDTKMTIGVDFEVKSLNINGKKIKFQIWDFGVEKRFRFLLPTYMRGANGALFIFNARSFSSLAHIDDWLLIIRREIRSEHDTFPIIAVGIVKESEEEREISSEEGINIARSRQVDGYIECDPITGENVEETFDKLARIMMQRSRLI